VVQVVILLRTLELPGNPSFDWRLGFLCVERIKRYFKIRGKHRP